MIIKYKIYLIFGFREMFQIVCSHKLFLLTAFVVLFSLFNI